MKYDLSLTQKDLYFDQLHCLGTAKYNIGGYIDISEAETDRLMRASDKLLALEPMISAKIIAEQSGPKAIVEKGELSTTQLINFEDEDAPIKSASEFLKSVFAQPFDLNAEHLYRAYIFKLDDKRHWFVLVAHHLLIDGWGFANWGESLNRLYTEGETKSSFSDVTNYFEQDESYLSSARYQRDKTFWLDYLKGKTRNILTLNREITEGVTSQRINASVSRSLFNEALASHSQFKQSPHSLFLALSFILFSRQSGKSQYTIGVPVHNRRTAEQKKQIALYTSVSPVHLSVQGDMSFLEFMNAVMAEQKNVFRHQKYPIGHMVASLGAEARSGLFDVGVNYLKLNNRSKFDSGEASYHYCENPYQTTPFNLTIWNNGDVHDLELQADFHLGYFTETEVQQNLDLLLSLLSQVCDNPEVKISDLELVSSNEAQALLANQTAIDVPLQSVPEAFIQHAQKTPNQVALGFKNADWNYLQLNRLANSLAMRFQEQGVNAGDLVGLLFNRSPKMLVSMLALHKLGAGFIPMDPNYPENRLEHMVQDSETQLVVTEPSLGNLAHKLCSNACIIDELTEIESATEVFAASNFDMNATAYVIYTSGSTGKPKGVEISHFAFANFIRSMAKKPGIKQDDTLLAVTPFSFDISLLELFLPLYSGAKVEIFPTPITQGLDQLIDVLASGSISMLQMTPSAWKLLLASGWQGCAHLKALTGGEALPGHLAAELQGKVNTLWNMYGPTETTIWSSCTQVTKDWQLNNIGGPIDNTQMVILDESKKLVPQGWFGHLYIGGDGLAKGYYNQPELTHSRFIECHGQKWYHTGDIARLLPSGEIEFLGRADHQVKFQGYRIELGEIESVLKRIPGIQDAVALVKTTESGKQCLCAYYISHSGLTLEKLRSAVSEHLPVHMLPTHWLAMEAFPLTPSGKTDTKALKIPNEVKLTKKTTSGDELVDKINLIVSKHLQLPSLENKANFFDVGARSQDIVELTPQINEQLQLDLTVVDLFSYPSVATLVQFIRSTKTTKTTQSDTKRLQRGRSRLQQRLNTRKKVNEL